MITLEQIITAMATKLLADSALAAWVTSTYGAAHPTWALQVQIGEDGNNPPTAGNGPLVVITPVPRGSKIGEGQNPLRFAVDVDWALDDDAKDTTTPNLTVYTGTYRCDQLGQLVYAALLTISDAVTIEQADYGIDAALTWPLCVGGMTVYIDVPNIIGADVAL